MAAGRDDIVRKAAVHFATDDGAIGAEVRSAGPAVDTGAAEYDRIDQHTIAGADGTADLANDFAGDLVAHDDRVRGWHGAGEDLEVGAADAAVADSDEHFAGFGLGRGDVAGREVEGFSKDDGLHRAGFYLLCCACRRPERGARAIGVSA